MRVYYTFFTLSLYISDFVAKEEERRKKNNKPEREESLRKFEPVENGLNRANYEFSLVSNATIDHVPNSIPSHFN